MNKNIKFIVSSEEQNALAGFEKVENKAQDLQATLGKLGLAFGAMEVGKFLFDAAKSSAGLEVLRSNFQGTAQDIENFNKATAGTVTEANLIKLSNQASDLGVTLAQQVILFAAAENAGDKYGGSLEENFQKIVLASEGATKGLKSLGIQKEVYETIVAKLAKAQGDVITNLDAETQKTIRLQAIIQSLNMTMDEALANTADDADRIESWGVLWENVTNKIGSIALPVLFGLGDALERTWYHLSNIARLPADILRTVGVDISDQALGLSSTPKYGGESNKGSMEALAEEVRVKLESEKASKKVVGAVEQVRKQIKELTIANLDANIGWNQYYANLEKIEDLTNRLKLPLQTISRDMKNFAIDAKSVGMIEESTQIEEMKNRMKRFGIGDLKEINAGEKPKYNFMDANTEFIEDSMRVISNSSANIFQDAMIGAWEKIFGEANSLAEKFFANLISGITDLAASRISTGIFNFAVDAISGGSLGFFESIGKAFTGGKSMQTNTGNTTTVIKIGDSTVLKLVNGVLPQAYNDSVRYREIGALT